MIDLLTD